MLKTANEAYLETIQAVLTRGQVVSDIIKSTGAGGRPSQEILSHTLAFNMQYPVVTVKPKTSYLYMVSEAWWILSGSNRLNSLPEVKRIQEPYSDNSLSLNGAYGPPFKSQMQYVIDKLNYDPASRQAVMTIWRRNPKQSKDIPCTISIQWIIRWEKINAIVTMRSSDVGMGLPYDMFSFVCMTAEIASKLTSPVELGECYITAGSRHIYSNQLDEIIEVAEHVSHEPSKPWNMWKWPAIRQNIETFANHSIPDNERQDYQSRIRKYLTHFDYAMWRE